MRSTPFLVEFSRRTCEGACQQLCRHSRQENVRAVEKWEEGAVQRTCHALCARRFPVCAAGQRVTVMAEPSELGSLRPFVPTSRRVGLPRTRAFGAAGERPEPSLAGQHWCAPRTLRRGLRFLYAFAGGPVTSRTPPGHSAPFPGYRRGRSCLLSSGMDSRALGPDSAVHGRCSPAPLGALPASVPLSCPHLLLRRRFETRSVWSPHRRARWPWPPGLLRLQNGRP